MKKPVLCAIIIAIAVVACDDKEAKDKPAPVTAVPETKMPYEATWMELSEVGDSYVVYNFLDWDETDEKYRTPTKNRVVGNQLTHVYFHEAARTYLIDKVRERDDGVYFLRSTEGQDTDLIDSLGFKKFNLHSPVDSIEHSFQWVDKEKHIARWILYYENGSIQDSQLYIDSAYNTFPIVDYEWAPYPPTRKCENFATEMATPSPPDMSSNPDSIAMVFVEGGTFMMGCTEEQGNDCKSDEKTRSVTVGSFYLAKYETTQGLWKAVTGAFPSSADSAWGIGYNFPVYDVNWIEAQPFMEKLNAKTGKKYRLPTDEEWEYAARGGNKSKAYKYSGSNIIGDVAWYDDMDVYDGSGYNLADGGCTTRPVGIKQANELGIHDMSGNIAEMTGTQTKSGLYSPDRFRGGSFMDGASPCRVSNHFGNSPDFKSKSMGFRLARDP